MAIRSKKKPSGVTAAGIVEAIEQDVELSIEQAKDAVVEVEEKLGLRKTPKPRKRGAPTTPLKNRP